MKTVFKIVAPKKQSYSLYEWGSKEYGAFEDNEKDPAHVYALLQRLKGTVYFTRGELETLIESGEYQSTSWNDDEIEGGVVTKRCIANWVTKFKTLLNS